MWPERVSLQRGATRMPVAMASIDPASTACTSVVSAPSSWMRAKAKGWSNGCCSVGADTQVQDVTVPAGPTSTSASWSSSAPVSGSHSSGGHRTRSPLRMPRIRCSARPLRNAPITGPRDRL